MPAGIEIGTTLRYLMYHDSYGEQAKARELFGKLTPEAQCIENIDYTKAAELCPNGVDIAAHMSRAAKVLKG